MTTSSEALWSDGDLAILPSGTKVTTDQVAYFNAAELEYDETNEPLATILFRNGGEITLRGATDIAAYDAALNAVGVYVNAPTMPGEDADGDGLTGE